jgi:S1-C subfamily serine protease
MHVLVFAFCLTLRADTGQTPAPENVISSPSLQEVIAQVRTSIVRVEVKAEFLLEPIPNTDVPFSGVLAPKPALVSISITETGFIANSRGDIVTAGHLVYQPLFQQAEEMYKANKRTIIPGSFKQTSLMVS